MSLGFRHIWERLARKLTIVSSQHHRLLGNLNNCSLLVSYIHTHATAIFHNLSSPIRKSESEWVVLLNLIFFAASFSTVLATFWHEEWLTHAEPTLTAHDDTSVLRISLLSVKSVAGQLLYQNSPIRVKNFMEFWTFSSWLWYACKNQPAKNETIFLLFFTTVHKNLEEKLNLNAIHVCIRPNHLSSFAKATLGFWQKDVTNAIPEINV